LLSDILTLTGFVFTALFLGQTDLFARMFSNLPFGRSYCSKSTRFNILFSFFYIWLLFCFETDL